MSEEAAKWPSTDRLLNELAVLLRSQQRFEINVSNTAAQLIVAEAEPIIHIPLVPKWRCFRWPADGFVSFKYPK